MRMLMHTRFPHAKFNAAVKDDVQFHIVMSPEDLGRSGLEAISKKWS